MLLALGLFPFDISTLAFDELQRRASWKHPGTPRIGARDAHQFAGPGEETISLSGTVYAEIADGEVCLDQLRRMAATGDTWPLVDAYGRIYGAFVITAVDERRQHFAPGGLARAIDFGLDLLRVDDDA